MFACLCLATCVAAWTAQPGLAQAQSVTSPAAPALLVTIARAKSESVQQTVSGVGNALAMATVTLHARVDGQLEQLNFQDGDDVKAGQVLARLDSRSFQAQLDQANAQKAKDEAQLVNAQNDLQRYEALIKEEATTQQVLDTQKALVSQLRAVVQADQAQANYAGVQLGYTTIAAPISGRVGARLIDQGNIVHAADAVGLVVINQIDPIAVQFSLPESNVQAIHLAQRSGHKRLKVEVMDRTTRELLGTGELVLVNNQIDIASGTIGLKARISNPTRSLWPGQSVNVRLTLSTLDKVVTIPSSAVQRGQDGLFVYVVGAADKVHVQPVTLAQTEGNLSVISKGLNDGDRVVVDGMYRMVEGALVKEASSAAPPAAASSASGVKP